MTADKLKRIVRVAGVLAAGALMAVMGVGVSVASAEGGSPWWHLHLGSHPTHLPPGGEGVLFVVASNVGDGSVEGGGAPVTVTDTLPAGVSATSVESDTNFFNHFGGAECSGSTVVVCTFSGSLPPYGQLEIKIHVSVRAGASSGELNRVGVTGGGAPSASMGQPITVDSSPTPFGVESYEFAPEEVGGSPATQAGSHPFQLTSTLYLNGGEEVFAGGTQRKVLQPAMLKDLRFALPPGLVGNPSPFPVCSDTQFVVKGFFANECPADTQVGVAVVSVFVPRSLGRVTVAEPVFALKPALGEPARFGFVAVVVPIILDTSVRAGGDYGVTVSVNNLSEIPAVYSSEVTLWGVPGDPRHDNSRGNACVGGEHIVFGCTSPGSSVGAPLLSLPTSCGDPLSEPLTSSVSADSWADPSAVTAPTVYRWHDGSGAPLALDGCNRPGFEPSISVTPDGQAASTPTGLTVGIHVPQQSILNPTGLAQADVKDTTVTLPEGVQISPAAADGLLSCSTTQVGFTGAESGTGTNLFTPGYGECPDASKVGTVEIKSPLLPDPLVGAVYLAAQNANPFGSLIGLYIEAEDPTAGVVVKLAGEVKPNEATGQIVTVFPNSPQLPFEDAKLHFFGSDRAPLSTPPSCGAYTSTASIAPWSGNAPVAPTSTFDITSGPNGSPCASPRPFQPGFEAGTTSVQAGGYSPLTLTMSRPDADQPLGKLSVVLPPGVSAGLRGVKLCEEPQAAQGDCPAESQIGKVIVSAGLAGDPFSVETGKAYITGPYKGDPFGVDVVVPAVAGPFNLGTEVVRSKVDVDPTDAHLTVVTDRFPTMLDGIPLQLQHVNVTVDRPGFVFNPSSCEPMKLTGELESSEGASANVSTPFQVTNCAALSFKPEFKVQTSAKTSRTEGASLHVALTLPAGAQGTKANVAKVKVSLPKQLPSPLKTLQKACTEKVFAENPSNCPTASRVGEATVSTPVLEGPLSGPAYFVSHGGAKYPELIMVLVGEDGVTVQVHGETFISKQGITSATFNTVPDVPFSTFELTLPKREYPALSANGNLCKGTLLMPTEMVGQNGLKINQSTKITVTGCPKQKKVAHKKKHKGRKAGRSKRKRR